MNKGIFSFGVPPGAPAGAGWDLLQVYTASASPSIDFDSFIDSNYAVYAMIFNAAVNATTAVTPRIRLKYAGAYDTAANYYNVQTYNTSAAPTPTGYGTNVGTCIDLYINNIPNGGPGNNTSGTVILYHPSNTAVGSQLTYDVVVYDAAVGIIRSSGAGGNVNVGGAAANAVTGLRFLFSSGNITSGEFRLYGFRKI